MPPQNHSSLDGLLMNFDPADPSARNEVLQRSQDRVRGLASKMLRGFPKVRRLQETDDVLVEALNRMNGALRDVQVAAAADFYRLAATNIKRALLDLARSCRQFSQTHCTPPADENGQTLTFEPGVEDDIKSLEVWEAFHAAVDDFDEEQRQAFKLTYYLGLTQTEAAKVMGVSARTVRRRLVEIKLRLGDIFGDDLLG